MAGSFHHQMHICDPPFQMQGPVWLGLVWRCKDCQREWEAMAIVGKGLIQPKEVEWALLGLPTEYLTKSRRRKEVKKDLAYRRDMKESS